MIHWELIQHNRDFRYDQCLATLREGYSLTPTKPRTGVDEPLERGHCTRWTNCNGIWPCSDKQEC